MSEIEVTFDWDGETFPAYTDNQDWFAGETIAVEKWLGPIDEVTTYQLGLAILAVSIKRRRPTFVLKSVEQWPNRVVAGLADQINPAIRANRKNAEETDPEPEDGTILSPTPGEPAQS